MARILSGSSVAEIEARIKQERVTKRDKSAQLYERYVKDCARIRRKKDKKYHEKVSSANFKAEALLFGLQKQQQNPSLYHSSTTDFCVANNQPPLTSLVRLPLPEEPELTEENDEDVLDHHGSSGHNSNCEDPLEDIIGDTTVAEENE